MRYTVICSLIIFCSFFSVVKGEEKEIVTIKATFKGSPWENPTVVLEYVNNSKKESFWLGLVGECGYPDIKVEIDGKPAEYLTPLATLGETDFPPTVQKMLLPGKSEKEIIRLSCAFKIPKTWETIKVTPWKSFGKNWNTRIIEAKAKKNEDLTRDVEFGSNLGKAFFVESNIGSKIYRPNEKKKIWFTLKNISGERKSIKKEDVLEEFISKRLVLTNFYNEEVFRAENFKVKDQAFTLKPGETFTFFFDADELFDRKTGKEGYFLVKFRPLKTDKHNKLLLFDSGVSFLVSTKVDPKKVEKFRGNYIGRFKKKELMSGNKLSIDEKIKIIQLESFFYNMTGWNLFFNIDPPVVLSCLDKVPTKGQLFDKNLTRLLLLNDVAARRKAVKLFKKHFTSESLKKALANIKADQVDQEIIENIAKLLEQK